MPKIQPLNIDLTEYDTVILGAPVWWYAFAPAMKTFLHDTDLSGKTVYPLQQMEAGLAILSKIL